MKYTLGLDLGTNSIGWAIVDKANAGIVDSGVLIFSMGVNLEKGTKEVSKNETRRLKRQTRRQNVRRKARRKQLARKLMEWGMFPEVALKNWEKRIGALKLDSELAAFFAIDPYEVRLKGAEGEALSLIELGRIFYHFSQRRGYQENIQTEGDDGGKEKGVIYKGGKGKSGILSTQKEIEENGPTLGAYLAKLNPHELRRRNRYTTRQMYIAEFDHLWEKQSHFHPEVLTPELQFELGDARNGLLFYQRPLRSQKHLIGKCAFESDKPRCPDSSPVFEEFRMWQNLNHLRYLGEPLAAENRSRLATLFQSNKTVLKLSRIAKTLKLDPRYFNFFQQDKDFTFSGCPSIAKLSQKSVFGQAKWNALPFSEKEAIWQILYTARTPEWLVKYAKEKWGFSEESALAFSKLRLTRDYGNLSRKAILNILPFLRRGYVFSSAILLGGMRKALGRKKWDAMSSEAQIELCDTVEGMVGTGEVGGVMDPLKELLSERFGLSNKRLALLYHPSQVGVGGELMERLPVPAHVRNPIVEKVLFKVRNLVNALLEVHGSFSEIRVELARELKGSKEERDRIRKGHERNRAKNDALKARLAEYGLPPTRHRLLKLELWEECKGICPYSGQVIGIEDLFNDGYIQIEHIIPRSISLDDSRGNKTLCVAEINQAKGDQTPFQFYRDNPGHWNTVKSRVFKLLPSHKARRFCEETAPDLEGFISRQLNDTRYMSRLTLHYLKKVCPNVRVSQGKVTEILRRHWGLNSLLNPVVPIDSDLRGDCLAAVAENGEVLALESYVEGQFKAIRDRLKKQGRVVEGIAKNFRFIPRKNRDNHLHHAIDAVVTAFSEQSHLQKLSTLSAQGRMAQGEKTPIPAPVENFRNRVDMALRNILIWHEKRRKVLVNARRKVYEKGEKYQAQGWAARGALHKETVFGKHGTDENPVFHIRKGIESITDWKQVNKIVDVGIRRLVGAHLEHAGISKESKAKFPPGIFLQTDEEGNPVPKVFLPNKNGAHIPIRKVRIRENMSNAVQIKEGLNQWVNPMNNHHVAFYESPDGKWAEEMVSFWVAVERKRQGLDLVQAQNERGWPLVLTLQKEDLFLLGLPEDLQDPEQWTRAEVAPYLYRVQKISAGNYAFRKARAATIEYESEWINVRSMGRLQGLFPVKVHLDILGQIIH